MHSTGTRSNIFALFPQFKVDSYCGPTQSCCPAVMPKTNEQHAPTSLGIRPTFIAQYSPLSPSNEDAPPPARENTLVACPDVRKASSRLSKAVFQTLDDVLETMLILLSNLVSGSFVEDHILSMLVWDCQTFFARWIHTFVLSFDMIPTKL